MSEFRETIRTVDERLASVSIPSFAQAGTAGKAGAALN
jgi:hypothetical protein